MGTTDLPALPPARPAPSSRSPLSARAFGTHLLIGDLIGRGGMSRVYRGWIRDTGAEVAVKVLRDDLASRPDAVHRFVRERELLQAVASPHVVQVHDLVVHGDELGIVMDLVPGGHLRKAVTFPRDLDRAAELAAQIADGLAAVHGAGVVHRDLKPENVLVEPVPDGTTRLRLTDFGISRLVDSAALTQTQVTGTPGYLAPEVAAGGKVTAAADVYALGVMLYEMCTGRQPFVAENPLLLVLAHTRQEPPRPVGMPDELWAILSRTLAKEAAARPGAAQVARDLRAIAPNLAGLPPCTVPAGPPVDAAPVVAPPAASAGSGPGPGGRSPYGPASPPRGADGRGRAGYVVLAPGGGPDEPRPSGDGAEPSGSSAGPGRAARRVDERDRGRRLPVPMPAAVGGAIAAVVLLVVGVVLVKNLATGSPDATVDLRPTPPPTQVGPTSSVTAVLPDVSSVPADRPRATGPAPPTTRVSSTPGKASASGSSSHGPSPAVSPGVPTLTRVARSAKEQHSSDRHATLALGKVAAGAGDVAGITVRWSADGQGDGRQEVPVSSDAAATDYDVTVNGLVNGAAYTFTAVVCNSGKLCTSSAPVTFTPYGAPTVVAPVLSNVGPLVTVTVKPVVRNSNPGTTTCTVTVTGTPADTGAPTDRAVPATGGTLSFTGKTATVYVATQTCTTAGVSDGSATSNPLDTRAV